MSKESKDGWSHNTEDRKLIVPTTLILTYMTFVDKILLNRLRTKIQSNYHYMPVNYFQDYIASRRDTDTETEAVKQHKSNTRPISGTRLYLS
jgi:hypothetical protein